MVLVLLLASSAPLQHGLAATVIHWWVSPGESAAVKQLADSFDAVGGLWIDEAFSNPLEAQTAAIRRVVNGNPPTAAQFNLSEQYRDLVDQGLLSNLDDVAKKERWNNVLVPAAINDVVINGHFYAVPADIHLYAWFFYSKAAFKKANIIREPTDFAEFVEDLDKLKAANLIPLAIGSDAWQVKIVFDAILANVGGRQLFLAIYRDHNMNAVYSEQFKHVLVLFRKLHNYIDTGSRARKWNEATALVVSGDAGVQIMGDWAKGEFSAAHQIAGEDFGCFSGFGPNGPNIVGGDVFVFPKVKDVSEIKAQKLLAAVITSPAVQIAFIQKKGGLPVRNDISYSGFDECTILGISVMKNSARVLPYAEVFSPPELNHALRKAIADLWNTNETTDDALRAFANAL